MKKEEVKNLEDEFSSLFKHQNSPQQQQSSQNQENQSNLLQGQENPQQFNSVTFKQVALTQSESEQDFLDQVDGILGNAEDNDQQLTRREIMLNYKVNELKLMCKNLKQANTKLAERIEELQQPRSEIISQNSAEQSGSHNLTVMQNQFGQIQEELASYKNQLMKYQHSMTQQLNRKQEDMKRIISDLQDSRAEIDIMNRELKEKGRIIASLQHKNEELLIIIEEYQEGEKQRQDQYGQGRRGRRDTTNFNQRISSQMESMIDKLLKELKYEKKNSTKQVGEIKRLNGEVIELENKIKDKNSKIYQLEMHIIKISKQQQNYKQPRSPVKQESKYDARYQNDSSNSYKLQEPINTYIPHRPNNFISPFRQPYNSQSYKEQPSSKNKSHLANNSYNKNRISAERQGPLTNRAAAQTIKATSSSPYGLLPINKLYSNFTLMDLLNKEFKIRQAQKYVIACRIIDLYSKKTIQQNYQNLISQEIQIYNFSPQNLGGLKVKVNRLSKNQNYQTNQESMLYNMAFILDTLINQVQVVDAYLDSTLQLNIPDYIQLVLTKNSKQQKYKLLQQLATSIQQQFIH